MAQDDDPSFTAQVMKFLMALNNGADYRTGIYRTVIYSHNLFGPVVPPALVEYNIDVQMNLYGGYPSHSDVVPSAIFTGAFALLAILHITLFCINYSRGHYFTLSLAWAFHCILRVIGFATRLSWSLNITNVKEAIANEVILISPVVFLVSFNLVLAQRLFTWRHPVGGSRKLFASVMWTMYGLVAILVVVTIVAEFIPYNYYLSTSRFMLYQALVKWTAVMIITYSLTSISLIALSYFFQPTKKDENLYTYQPWWVESFSPFYFVKKNAAQICEETFMKRTRNHRQAIRVIAATHHHYKVVEGLANQRGDLTHNISLAIICVTTLLIFIGSLLRLIVVIEGNIQRNMSKAGSPVSLYICWGLFEVFIHLLYLVGRCDLRFYRPDILPLAIRSLVTAQQSQDNSDNEGPNVSEEESLQETEGEKSNISDTRDYEFDVESEGLYFSNPPQYYSPDKPVVSSRKSVSTSSSDKEDFYFEKGFEMVRKDDKNGKNNTDDDSFVF